MRGLPTGLATSCSHHLMEILIINPNSSRSMSQSLLDSIDRSNIHVYTGPSDSPKEINNDDDAILSTKAVLQDFERNPHYLRDYNRYLIACFSDHPLVASLKSIINPTAHVMGIFDASMQLAMETRPKSKKAVILTSGKEWEILLDTAVRKFFNSTTWPNSFAHTKSMGLSPLELEDPENYPLLHKTISSLAESDVSVIILGCAGLSPHLLNFKSDFPQLKFIDGVQSGIKLLSSSI